MQTRPRPRSGVRRGCARHGLTGAGLRPTRQRLALAELLVGDGRNRHVTAESLHDAATPRRRRRSRSPPSTTRCAPSATPGLMHEVTVDGTRSYFDTRIDDHPHYYWEEDGRLTDAPERRGASRRRRRSPRRAPSSTASTW